MQHVQPVAAELYQPLRVIGQADDQRALCCKQLDRQRHPWHERLVDKAVSSFGRVDIMVNNAGVETRTSILDTTEDQYDRVMAINLKGAFFGTQFAARQMIKQGAVAVLSTSPRCIRTGQCPATPLIACPKAECVC